jgi:glutamate-5-semialdehyde dehydrogenase
MNQNIEKQLIAAKKASKQLALLDAEQRNQALHKIAESLSSREKEILEANTLDIERARKEGMRESLVDRLALTEKRVASMNTSLSNIAAAADPLMNSPKGWRLDNGLEIRKVSVPFGVISIIYESRPNVTIDAISLALKSGNAVVLRGSSSAINSNRALVQAVHEALRSSSVPTDAVQFIDSEDRSLVLDLLKARDYIDLVLPRGGSGLIQFVVENAQVPSIETGIGNCHAYVDDSADLSMALEIVENAKVQRPGVCNAIETVLVHKNIAQNFIPELLERLKDKVEFRGDKSACEIAVNEDMKRAEEQDWFEEYLDYILAVKVVDSVEEAVEHISIYGSMHSEVIITNTLSNAKYFQNSVDAAAVYVNASTRFTDGEMFGFGAEMGISTQKMHARGPMGLQELCTTKYLIEGSGQIRT